LPPLHLQQAKEKASEAYEKVSDTAYEYKERAEEAAEHAMKGE